MGVNKMSKKEIRKELYEKEKKCHYCGIECGIEEGKFIQIWGWFYPKKPPYKTGKGRGKRLEIDHKDNDKRNDLPENCVLACPICNNAKSDKFTYEEFKKVGEVIKQIWPKHKKGVKDETHS